MDQVEQGGGEVLGDDWRRRKRWGNVITSMAMIVDDDNHPYF